MYYKFIWLLIFGLLAYIFYQADMRLRVILSIALVLGILYKTIRSSKLLGVLIIMLFFIGGFYVYETFLKSRIDLYFEEKQKIDFQKQEIKQDGAELIPVTQESYSQGDDFDNLQNASGSISSLGHNDFSMVNTTQGLELYYKEKSIKDIGKDDIKSISITEIYSNSGNDFFLIQGEKNMYLYNSALHKLIQIELELEVLYAKKIEDTIIFTTDKGSFHYDLLTKKIEYFPLFHDYVFWQGLYIGVIKSDDTIRKQNHGILQETLDTLWLYNPNSKKKKLLKRIENLEQIYIQENKIHVSNNQGLYILDNYNNPGN